MPLLKRICALSLFSLLVIAASAEVFFRLPSQQVSESRAGACLRFREGPHHEFLPNCREFVPTPAGPVEYKTNEDGLRDAPRAAFAGGAFVMLGDSKVEGWWLGPEQTLGARLTPLLEPTLGGDRLLNAGLRYSGPSMHLDRLRRARPHYPARGVLLFLNGSDVLDETLAHAVATARDETGAPTALGLADLRMPRWLDRAIELTGGHSRLLLSLRHRFYDRNVKQLVGNHPPSDTVLCSSVNAIAQQGLPIVTIVLPLGPNIGAFPYMGTAIEEAAFAKMVECARAASASLIDLRGRLSEAPSLYWSTHRNMNALGVAHLAEVLTPELGQALRKIKTADTRKAKAPARKTETKK